MIIFLDVETTGFKPESSDVVQLSYVVCEDDLKIKNAKNFYFMTDYMPDDAYSVHKLSLTKLKLLSKGGILADIADTVIGDICSTGTTLCGHNISFDVSMLKSNFERHGIGFEPFRTFDTMLSHMEILKLPNTSKRYHTDSGYKYPKLIEVLEYYGIDTEVVSNLAREVYGNDTGVGAHDSRFDTIACYLIYKRLVNVGNIL